MNTHGPLPTATYPNITEDNIPCKDELTRILDLIKCHEETIRRLTPKEEEAVTTTRALYTSFEQMKIRSEEARNQLYEAEMELRKISLQLRRAQDDLKILQGDVHPIRRCPTDILQYIFEIAVENNLPRSNSHARHLSQVCYRWRSIALSAPRVWSRVRFTIQACPVYMEEVWRQYVERIGNYPATVTLAAINHHDLSLEAMRRCRLDHLPRIDCLILRFDSGEAARRLIDEGQISFSSNIKRIVIESDWLRPNRYEMISSFPILTSNVFLNVHIAELGNFDFEDLTENHILPHITTIRVRRSQNLHLHLLAKVFPGAVAVELYAVSMMYYPAEVTIEWPELTSLVFDAIGGAEKIPWKWLNLPKIVELRLFHNGDVGETFGEFIRRHTTLLHLETPLLIPERIHEDAPQLVSYTTTAQSDMDVLALPKCPNLTLYQLDGRAIPCSLFEEIVRTYFLSRSNYIGQTPNKQPSLTILALQRRTAFHPPFPLLWRESKLLKDATEVHSIVKPWYEDLQSYRFEWK